MRIAMIGAKGIPASRALGGGIEYHVERLATHLESRGHHVVVYVRPYTNPQRKKTWNRIRLITLPTIRRKNLDAIIHVFFCSIHVLFQRVDIIHYHGVGPAILSWIPRVFKPSAKVICTIHARDQFHEKWSWFARTVLAFGEYASCRFPHRTIA
ncbi:MAG: glycosyltransferase family 4 protein, partial [Patescibacteria group bacterium]